MTAENAGENSGFKADEGLKCVSQLNLPRSAKGFHIFPHLCHETTSHKLNCSDGLPWQLEWLNTDVRGTCTIFSRTAILCFVQQTRSISRGITWDPLSQFCFLQSEKRDHGK